MMGRCSQGRTAWLLPLRRIRACGKGKWLVGEFLLNVLDVVGDGVVRDLLVPERLPEGDHRETLGLMIGIVQVRGPILQDHFWAEMLERSFIEDREEVQGRKERYRVLVVHEPQQRQRPIFSGSIAIRHFRLAERHGLPQRESIFFEKHEDNHRGRTAKTMAGHADFIVGFQQRFHKLIDLKRRIGKALVERHMYAAVDDLVIVHIKFHVDEVRSATHDHPLDLLRIVGLHEGLHAQSTRRTDGDASPLSSGLLNHLVTLIDQRRPLRILQHQREVDGGRGSTWGGLGDLPAGREAAQCCRQQCQAQKSTDGGVAEELHSVASLLLQVNGKPLGLYRSKESKSTILSFVVQGRFEAGSSQAALPPLLNLEILVFLTDKWVDTSGSKK